VSVVGIIARLKVESCFAPASDPAILIVFDPVRLLHDFEGREEPGEALRPVNSAPRHHHSIAPAWSGHQEKAAQFQGVRKALHYFDVAFILIDFDSVSSRNADMLDGGAIDGKIEVIAGKIELQEVTLPEFDVWVLPGERLFLKVVRYDVKTLLSGQQTHISLFAAEFDGLTRAAWHFRT
jgi:hypothetical protein